MAPPRLLTVLARLLIRGPGREFVIGDLVELYQRRESTLGRVRAAARFIGEVVRSALAGPAGPERPRSPSAGDSGSLGGELWASVWSSWRLLRRRPAFALLIVLTLALGIGPTITVLGVVDQLLMRPLEGAENSETAAYLTLRDPEDDFGGYGLTLQLFDEFRERLSLASGVASYGLTGQRVSVGASRPIRVSAETIYGDFFESLGVRPAEGRLIARPETTLDSDPLVVVISENLKNRLFSVGESAVGSTLQMNGHPVEIVGVAGGGFRGPVRGAPPVDAWLPHGALVPLVGFTREQLESPRSAMHSNILILPRADVTLDAIESQAANVLAALARDNPERREELERLQPILAGGLSIRPEERERVYRTLALMVSVAALLLAIACANVANLLLFQSLTRRGVVATMRALGATTGRIARQHMVSGLILGGLGGLLGLGCARLLSHLFTGEILLGMPDVGALSVDPRLALWIGLTVVVSVVLFATVPAALAGRFDLGGAFRAAHVGDTGRLGVLRTALASAQIALTLVLVVGMALMGRTIRNLNSIPTGVDVEGVVGVTVDVPSGLERERAHALQRALVQAAASQAGVQTTALDLYGPHGSEFRARIGFPDDSEEAWRSRPRVLAWQVSPSWFDLFGLQPVSGRTFGDTDWRVPSSGAAVLTESLARRLFGRTDVVGRTIRLESATPGERIVIGVVENYTSLINVAAPQVDDALRPSGSTDAVFVPYGDMPVFQMTVFARMAPSATGVPARLKAAVETLLPDMPSPEPWMVTDRIARIQREEQLLVRLLSVLSGFGAVLAGVGLFAALYFMVSSRKREFGIRAALGADRARILALVSHSAGLIVLLGCFAGTLVAIPLTRVLQNRLFGVTPLDPVSYGVAAAAVMLVAFVACMAPARAACGTDAVAVLRDE